MHIHMTSTAGLPPSKSPLPLTSLILIFYFRNYIYSPATIISAISANSVSKMESKQKPVMIVGVDDSDHSFHALEWTLDHLFVPSASDSPLFKLIVVHAKPSPTSVVVLSGPGAADVLPIVELDLKKIAARVMERAKELCLSKSMNDVDLEVVQGDARNVLCEAVERHHAAMLVVGSRGYGAIKRAVLGSVSDYITHHAHCTVMIVKKPKIKSPK